VRDGPVFTISIVPDFHPNEWIYWPRLSFTGPGGLSIGPGSNFINKTRAASTGTSSDALGKYIFTAVQGVLNGIPHTTPATVFRAIATLP